MNTESCCRSVEQKERLHKELFSTICIQDDHSPLISLKDLGFNLILEPAIIRDCQYRAREAVCAKIGRISRRLEEQDKVLIIRSVWRSFAHQSRLWNDNVDVMQKSTLTNARRTSRNSSRISLHRRGKPCMRPGGQSMR